MLEVFQLAVRLRLRLRRGNVVKDVVALVNSGYEAETPQLLIPIYLAKELGLWPPPIESVETIFSTAGGPLRVWIIRKAVKVKVLVEDVDTEEVDADIVVSHLVDEPLISDKLAGALKIAIEDLAEGLWRFRWEPKEKVRKTVQQYHLYLWIDIIIALNTYSKLRTLYSHNTNTTLYPKICDGRERELLHNDNVGENLILNKVRN